MEFLDHGGVKGYDLIRTRPSLRDQPRPEIDLGWVLVGGADPLAVMKKHADRVDMLHVKDFVHDASQPMGWRCVDVGKGVIDWGSALRLRQEVGQGHLCRTGSALRAPHLRLPPIRWRGETICASFWRPASSRMAL